jgi:hypothetical protein
MCRCENVSFLLKNRLSRGPLGEAIGRGLMRDVERALLRSLGMNA